MTTTPNDVLAALAAGDHVAAKHAAYHLPYGAGTLELVRVCLEAAAHSAAELAACRLPVGGATTELVRACLEAGNHDAAWWAAHYLPVGGATLELVRACLAAGARAAAMWAAYRLPDGCSTAHADIGPYAVQSFELDGEPWLLVGCELHPAAEWVECAEAIDERYGSPGLADQTRALAERLLAD